MDRISLNLYRLSTLSWSTGAIDTHWEKVDCRKAEEIVSTAGNSGEYVGELSPEETEECLIDPNTRIIKQVQVEDIGKADILFDNLMGTNVEPRKRYIEENAEKAVIYV